MKDKEMSFISRDQITINDDMEIMLRYCPYFQLEDKKASPFLVNTPETIQIRRVKSANYRPISTQQQITNDKSFCKFLNGKKKEIQQNHEKIIAETQPTITANYQTTTQPEDNKQKSILISPKMVKSTQNLFSPQVQDRRKSAIKNKFNNQNDIMQNKITTFMKLTPQKIEEMAIQQRLSNEEYKQKKLYINKYPFRTSQQMLNRIKSAIKIQSPVCIQSQRSSQQRQVYKGVTTAIKSLSPQDLTTLGEGSRIHSIKSSNQINFDFSALPLKYQASFISSQYQKRKNSIIGTTSKFRQNSNIQFIATNL